MPAAGSTLSEVTDPPERTLLVIGGAEDKRRRVLVLKRFVSLAGGRHARIVVIPTASSMAQEAVEVYRSVFTRLHARDVSAVHPRSREQAGAPDLLAAVDLATGVFITGGNQLKLAQLIVGTPLAAAIRRAYERGAVVAGTSAGASVLSQFMISLGDEGVTPRQRSAQLTAGLGLLPGVILDQHFAQRTRYGRLLSLVAGSPSLLGVGIDEDTAAEITDERTLRVVGGGAVYVVDGRAAVSDAHEARRDAPLLVSGAVVHSLPWGAVFDLHDVALRDFEEQHAEVAVVTSPTDVHETANAAAALRR
ncbi:MAG: cyanophycinase [Ornithinimicrobium sp.]|jgi:cyanophycinase|uniref:cyanophycinase n=1 Tax=Ornithinimicrobium sp. TaxID=1977084 RepID=UPI003D9B3CF1